MKYFALLVKADTWDILKDRVTFIHSKTGPYIELKKDDVLAVSPTAFPATPATKQAFDEFCRALNRGELTRGDPPSQKLK